MATTSGTHEGDSGQELDPLEAATGVVEPVPSETPTRPLVGVGDRCVTCDSSLAPDQRYCLNCGERRGKSRFPVQSALSSTAEPAQASAKSRREPPKRRMSSGATLVAGIATLLLAMFVGLEIGHLGKSGNGTPARASTPVQVVTVGGGGGAATTTPTASDTQSNNNAKASKNKGSSKKTVVVTKKVAAKANQAASKVLGASAANLAPTQVQQGQSCSHGAGCQNGKFTGNFFGP
jgi:hypothetical protein